MQSSWGKGPDLSANERGDSAIHFGCAKVASPEAGLPITQGLFDWVVARATGAAEARNRSSRNLRVLNLHDPTEAKLQAIGAYALKGRPRPSFYD
ncbi:hypothetical protein [Cyanobium sp. Morenito 9A2]|uniref:hypothetical protein n=1 Tax=Cyanobium sp. Morenito 9A2 TaxID=2823718 RepID=UPI0020CEB8EF|nr:hypothetical protein [Cyanobium sp. Morenito 9A2]MCP9851088.1 hypothetical protein [Cyanobium sp. Morenito 9A2]